MSSTLIIAEAGVNHNGDINIAKQLIDAAVDAGVDYVKFQTFKASKLVSSKAEKAEYQTRNTNNIVETQLEMLQKLELSEKQHYELIAYCNERGVRFLSTAFDLDSLDFLKKLGLTLFKIPSGELTNLPYIERVAAVANSIILSTGMSTLAEIEETISVLKASSDVPISILHCNTEYPTPFTDVNLLAMSELQRHFRVPVGYSDHTIGIEVPIAAVALGATIIEKHFTLDRLMDGPDHAASIEPGELKQMVRAIRNIEMSLGTKVKEPSASEQKNKVIARKSIYLTNPKIKGETIEEKDLVMLRPGDGISPMRFREIIGKMCKKRLPKGHKLSLDDLEQ
jgi:N,N'-diacetyllegionaminate synthase